MNAELINLASMIKIFIDTETTGLNTGKHSVHQIAGIIEIDGEVVDKFDISFAPRLDAEISKEALDKCKLTEEELRARPLDYEGGYKAFKSKLKEYINPYDRGVKALFVAYNAFFDNGFLRALFLDNKDNYFGSFFWSGNIDILALAAEYLAERRPDMPNFKLLSVAEELGLFFDADKLHDALVDIELSREVYRIVTSRIYEI